MTMVGSSVAVLGILEDFPVFAGQALRFALAAAILLVVLRLRSTSPRMQPMAARHWGRVAILAAFGMVGFNLAVIAAEQDTDPALVGVIVGSAPVVIALVTPLAARTAPSGRLVLAGIVVLSGAALAQGTGSSSSTAGLLLSVCALAGEVTFALIAAPIVGTLGALPVSTYACVLAVPLCLLGVAVTRQADVPDMGQLAALVWLGVVVTALAYVLWFTAVGDIGPERAALFTGLVPISAVAVTALLGTGSPTWAHIGGAAVVLVGLLLGLATGRRLPAPTPEANLSSSKSVV